MERASNIALVPVETDLDVTNVKALRATLERLMDGGCKRIILNMAGASYVDSAGMALIVMSIRRMREMGGLLSLVNVSNPVLAILRRVRIVDYAPVSSGEAQTAYHELSPSVLPLWRSVVPVDCCNLAAARARVSELLTRVPLTQDEAFDILLAIGEALGNAADHTDGRGAMVTLSGYSDRVVAEVSDCGGGFDPKATRECASEERGRGIRLMRMLADSVRICPKPSGMGMLVRIVKIAHSKR